MNLSKQNKLAKELNKKSTQLYKLYKNGESLNSIGLKYGVARSTIGRIFKSKNLSIRTGGETQKIYLSSIQKKEIKSLLKKNYSLKIICQKVKIGKTPLYNFLKDSELLPGIRYLDLPDKKICYDYKKGMTAEKLALKYDVNTKTITFRLKKNKIKMRNSKDYVTKIVKNISFHYKDLINTPKLLGEKAKELEINRNTLRSKFKQAGYKLRTKQEEQIVLNRLKNPNLKYKFFQKKSSLRDYWVGFIAADGAVIAGNKDIKKKLKLAITLGEKDKSHCYKLQKILGGGSITSFDFSKYNEKYKNKYKSIKNFLKGGVSFKYELSNTLLCRDLVKLGITPRKTHTFKPHKSLQFSKDFWRGIIDGDGSLTNLDKTRSTNLALGTGSKNEFQAYLNFLEKKKIKPNIQIKKEFNTFYVITLSGTNARSIASFLYKGAPPLGRLDRKYDLYLQWKKRRRKIFFSQ